MGKKSKKADRAVEEIACQHCAAAVSSRSKIVCVCTQVVFCSSACETQALASGGDLEKGSGQSAKEPLCTGVPVPRRRALLAAALKVDEPTLAVAATVAGIACFGAREQVFARPLVVEHVAKVVNMSSG